MRSAFDFTPYRRSTIGFDRLFDMMENNAGPGQDNYPPFDLIQLDENDYRIDLAVAGFKSEEIDITAQQNVLIVAGKKRDEDDRNFIHRGIATRSFERRFALADHIQVRPPTLRTACCQRAGTRDPRGDEAAQDRHWRRGQGPFGDWQWRRSRSRRLAADDRCRGAGRLTRCQAEPRKWLRGSA